MDFRSRGVQQPHTNTASSAPASQPSYGGNKTNVAGWLERGSLVLLFSVAILILAIAALTFFSGNGESKAILKDKYQAVFLNNGQVYFGNISDLNSKYVDLKNIYYLQTNGSNASSATTSSSNNNVSLVKLGCELHAPYDEMIINRDQVLFWENLQDGGQVVKAINQYKKDNPKGQTCSTNSQNSTQQAPTSNTSTQSGTSPTGSSSTPTAKP